MVAKTILIADGGSNENGLEYCVRQLGDRPDQDRRN